MHRFTPETDRLARAVVEYALQRVRMDPPPLDGPASPAELEARVGQTITPEGIGGLEALRVFADELAPATISVDHPRYLSFIPAAPNEAAVLFDLVVGASSVYGGSWLEGAGAVYAENQALAWLTRLVGFPLTAGGTFVQGGTAGNLSALVAARDEALRRRGGHHPRRWVVATSEEAHSSIGAAAKVMDVDVLGVGTDAAHRLTGPSLSAAVETLHADDAVFAVAATAGTTNIGVVDDLDSIAAVCEERGWWMHVDGAYGLAALTVDAYRPLFRGVERADSFIVDPHKWLFAPFDSCALVYRDPAVAKAAHAQHAAYLEPIHATGEWNPSDYAVHLTRRARGLPLWFALATYGTDAFAAAIGHALDVSRQAADEIRARSDLELLLDPVLSIVLFRRHGWVGDDYAAWMQHLLEAQIAFVVPTAFQGEIVGRMAFVNPQTTIEDVRLVLDTMR
ncbi:MAG: aminotransferase class V-fold PLP-dependent enzyme [Acidimicrobiia bacterium]|nr:aminotransferase class V-fold PLP-dependent enzyme [Acidimicrobiia bacterium]